MQWLLKIIKTDDSVHSFEFKCTKRQIDSVFHGLSFACRGSNIKFVRLYIMVRNASELNYKYIPHLKLDCSDEFYRVAVEDKKNV